MAKSQEKIDLAKLKEWFSDSQRSSSRWRKSAREWYDFRSGEQWSDEDKEALEAQQRPIITFNRTGPQVDSVCGLEINNRHEITYQPREIGDVKVNELLTGAVKWVRDNCDAEDEESQAFEDCIVCGLGATETYMDYDVNPEGDIIISRVDPLEMFWEGSARKVNLDDTRYIFRVRKIPVAVAKDMFPAVKDEATLNAGWAAAYDVNVTTETDLDDDYGGASNADSDNEAGDVTIVEAQWYEQKRVYLIKDPMSGEKKVLEKDEHKMLMERLPEMGIPADAVDVVPMTKKIFKRAFVGQEILKREDSPCPDSFTYKFITGKQNRNNGELYGVLKAMQDPQRWANKWLSQTMHILNVNPKGGVMAESDAVPNWAQFEASWADPSLVTKVNPGAIAGGKIKEKTSATLPTGIDRLLQFAIDSIPQVTGINPDAIGLADRNQPGVLEHMRKQSMMTNLAGYFSHLRKYRKEQGRLLLHFIVEYMSDGRLVRIGGGQTAQYVQLMKQGGVSDYDVIVDDSPTAPNQKDQTWGVIQQLLPIISSLGMPPDIWPEIIKYSPLPTTMTDKISEIMEQAKQQQAQGPPPDPKMIEIQVKAQEADARFQLDKEKHQIEMMQLTANVKKTESETIKNLALAEAAELGQQFEQYKAQMGVLAQDIAHQNEMIRQVQSQQAQAEQANQAHQQQMAAQQSQMGQAHGQELEKMKMAQQMAPPPAQQGQ
jgi:hypothetical protein